MILLQKSLNIFIIKNCCFNILILKVWKVILIQFKLLRNLELKLINIYDLSLDFFKLFRFLIFFNFSNILLQQVLLIFNIFWEFLLKIFDYCFRLILKQFDFLLQVSFLIFNCLVFFNLYIYYHILTFSLDFWNEVFLFKFNL